MTDFTLPVKTGALHFADPRLGRPATLEDLANGLYFEMALRAGVRVPPLSQVHDGPPLEAKVNHNRWIVECPDCGGAEYVFPEQPLMLCASCWNAAVGGSWRRVVMPSERDAIENALVVRPTPQARNWEPGEKVAQLRAENIERGLPGERGRGRAT